VLNLKRLIRFWKRQAKKVEEKCDIMNCSSSISQGLELWIAFASLVILGLPLIGCIKVIKTARKLFKRFLKLIKRYLSKGKIN